MGAEDRLRRENADDHQEQSSGDDRVAQVDVPGNRLDADDENHGEGDERGGQPHGDIERAGEASATLNLLLSAAARAVMGDWMEPRTKGQPQGA